MGRTLQWSSHLGRRMILVRVRELGFIFIFKYYLSPFIVKASV